MMQIVMRQTSLIVGGRPYGYDQFRDLRLDVDNMSYEVFSRLHVWLCFLSLTRFSLKLNIYIYTHTLLWQELLELGDSIGYVNTGLREDEMTKCLRSSKLALSDHLSLRFALDMERKCSICQVGQSCLLYLCLLNFKR